MSFDDRLLRITIMVGDEKKIYEKLTMEVNGIKYTNANAGTCIIQITNLTPDIRNQIASAASPYLNDKKLKTIKKQGTSNGKACTLTSFFLSFVTASYLRRQRSRSTNKATQ